MEEDTSLDAQDETSASRPLASSTDANHLDEEVINVRLNVGLYDQIDIQICLSDRMCDIIEKCRIIADIPLTMVSKFLVGVYPEQSSECLSTVKELGIQDGDEILLLSYEPAAVNNEIAKFHSSLYNHDMDILREKNVIQERFLQTCQGTTVGSVNGCTVISLLVCSYFHNSTDNYCINDDGLIKKIIDKDCIPILEEIRTMNNLDRLGLLSVYEVYPWLKERGHFTNVQFDTAGGNVFDDNDMNSMYTSLVQGFTNNEYRKTSANLYFRGHNLCLCMSHGEGNAICLDLIDSHNKSKQ
jgi:hypothetical protein